MDPERADKFEAELKCVQRLEAHGLAFGASLRELWLEYETQASVESRWVRVLDRLMPFLVNIATEGRNWKEQSICRSQLLQVNQPVLQHAPELHAWMVGQIDVFVYGDGSGMRNTLRYSLCALLATLAGCASTRGHPDHQQLVAQVTATEVAFAKTMADRDFAAFLTFIAEDAVFLGGATPTRGRTAP